jgi:hypothetical protein
MYPHVVQFETRGQQFGRELRLIRERTRARASSRPPAPRSERDLRGRPASQDSEKHELGHELTIERTLP